jgi:hypothetical protein
MKNQLYQNTTNDAKLVPQLFFNYNNYIQQDATFK